MPALTLAQLNAADQAGFTALLDGIYEHSPWIAAEAWAQKPASGFVSLDQLKHTLAQVVRTASQDAQLALIRAHPELAGKAAVAGQLTAESTNEQSKAGLTHCTPEEFQRLQQLNADYNARFGWPFILAVRGPHGRGLSRADIVRTFARRLNNTASFELAECLRNIHRIAEIRLNDKFGFTPAEGDLILQWAEALAAHTEGAGLDNGLDDQPPLTVTYLTEAHQACAIQLMAWMRACGFDEVTRDAVVAADTTAGSVSSCPWPVCGHCTPRADAFSTASRSWRSLKKKVSATPPPSWALRHWSATSTPPGWSWPTPTASPSARPCKPPA